MEVMGTLWINAILMTIVPLVVSKLVVSIAGLEDLRAIGQSGWKAAVRMSLGLLTVTATVTAAIMPTVFAGLPIDPAASASLRGVAARRRTSATPPTTRTGDLGLVPTNAIRAAAEGAIVPVLVFTVAFAFGASRIPAEPAGSTRDALHVRRCRDHGAAALDCPAFAVRRLRARSRPRDARRRRHRGQRWRTTSSCRR